MTGRTLEEIAESWGANTDEWCDDFPVLLAIAQGQREELEKARQFLSDDSVMLELAWEKHFDPLNGPSDPFTAGKVAMLKACRSVINAIGTKK